MKWGGRELGPEWRQSVKLTAKPNALHDVEAVTGALIADGMNRKKRLNVFGSSHGGMAALEAVLSTLGLYADVDEAIKHYAPLELFKVDARYPDILVHAEIDGPESVT